MEFKLHAPFKPTGDQPEAIEKLAQGVKMGLDEQVLLGVTGSGKTFTMASVIEKVQRPTLVLAHNKTLAAQLCAEFKEFFPENAVEYFVSYYDYYQPEAYIPHTDTYIAKDASTNEEIDRLRLSATCALLERCDVIVVSSVSCIYGLGEPEDFEKLMISLRPGMTMERDFLLKRLIEIRYERNDVAFERNRFRVRGDTVELYPAYYRDKAVRVEFFGDEIDRISEFNPVNGQVTRTLQHIAIYPASHYVTTKDKLERAIVEIDKELDEREAQFLAEGNVMKTMINSDHVTSLDVREMKMLSAQLSVNSILAKEEQYAVPVMVNDELMNVSVKIVRGVDKKGIVDIMMESELRGKIAATFQAKEDGIHGLVATDSEETAELFEEQAQNLMDSLGGENDDVTELHCAHIKDLDLNHFSMGAFGVDAKNETPTSEDQDTYRVQTSRLYGIAEHFIKAVKGTLAQEA